MTTQISAANIQASTLENLGGSPTITQVQVCDSNFTVLDDTAVGLTGGFIRILGTRFASGCQVLIDQTPATSVTFTSATELRVQVPALNAGTYILYVVNTDGSTAIRVNALTASQAPAWVTGSALGGAADAAISIQLSAPPATTYQLASGSTLPAGLSLSSGGLLSGTITGLTTETVYNFTVVATDLELQDSPRSFAITITVNDPEFTRVTTLLNPDLSVLPFNRDASTNNFPVTVFGDTRANNFSPYIPGYYSNFFDGTGDFLTAPSNSAQFNTGDFTIEFWVNLNSLAAATGIVDFRAASGATFGQIYIATDRTVHFYLPTDVATTNTITLNTWNHVAITRSSGTLRIFIDGVSGLSVSAPASYNAGGTVTIGGGVGGTSLMTGHLSNLRFVVGTAVYTANFTPPTQPLTAITNTSLLTCQSNQLIDNSSNNFAITRNGDVRVDGFDPFVIPQELLGRGSTYFDGTSDYLSVAGNAAFAMGTGDFTIEAWIYPTSVNTYWPITGQFASLSTGSGFNLFALNSTRQIELYYDGQTYAGLTAAAATLNTWNHVTVTRQGSTVRGFINGVLGGTFTYAGVFGTSSSNLEIGGTTRSGGPLWAVGYISNVRIIKGTALYTAAFTPPTQPLTAVANTSLLTCQTNQPHNNNQFLDSSTNSLLVTRSGNPTQGSFSPYGGSWSNYFDGSGDNLSYAGTTFGTGAYTIECWFNINNFLSTYALLSTNNANALNIRINNATTIAIDQQNVAQVTFTVPTMSTNTWYHIAVVRNSSNVCTVFLNGTRSSTGQSTISTNYSAASNLIGLIGSNHFPGYISNLRVVTGTALYDPTLSTITPPTQPLQPVAGTVLLTCCDNRFVDDSPNNFAITRNGDVRVDKFSPFGIHAAMTPISHSAYFDGTGDFLTVASNEAFGFGTGDFTVECWVYPTVNARQDWIDIANGTQRILLYYSGTNIVFYGVPPNAANITGPAMTLNAWTHLAISKQAGSTRLFVNGVQVGTTYATNQNYGTAASVTIGKDNAGSTHITGYMSNVRIVKGTALYTANFTPSTTPLTAVTNTSLLTCQSSTHVDNSPNRFAITASGDVRPTQVNPFGFTNGARTNYTTTAFGGSLSFDGTGDFLSIASNNAFALPGDFTFETWLYPTGFPSQFSGTIFNIGTFQTGLFIRVSSTNIVVIIVNTAVLEPTRSTFIPAANAWYHLAVVRRGSTVTLYVNGVAAATATNSTAIPANAVTVGMSAHNTTETFAGHLSGLRLVKGTALYTSNFVPQATPLQPIADTTLLLNGTSAAVYDSSTLNNLETAGDARTATNITRYGNSSMFFDGTGDYVTTSGTYAFGTSPFTIEAWIHPTAYPGSSWAGICGNITTGTGNAQILLSIKPGGFVGFLTWNTWIIDNTTVSAPLNTWTHVAVTFNGTTYRLFLNGTQVGSSTTVQTLSTPGPFSVGYSGNTGVFNFTGFVSDFRITNGAARYTANFTPPAVAHQIR